MPRLGRAAIVTIDRCCDNTAPVTDDLWIDEDGRGHRAVDCGNCGTRLLRLNWYTAEAWCNHDAAAIVDGVCECGADVAPRLSAGKRSYPLSYRH